jgi:hypothetical protein
MYNNSSTIQVNGVYSKTIGKSISYHINPQQCVQKILNSKRVEAYESCTTMRRCYRIPLGFFKYTWSRKFP